MAQRTYSAEEFAQLPVPDCPVCGIPVDLNRLDVTLNAEQEAREGRRYIAGRWECPRGCNPLTGERLHGDHTVESGVADYVRAWCKLWRRRFISYYPNSAAGLKHTPARLPVNLEVFREGDTVWIRDTDTDDEWPLPAEVWAELPSVWDTHPADRQTGLADATPPDGKS